MYDITADSWTQKTSMPDFYRSSHYLTVVIDEKLMIVDALSFETNKDDTQKVLIYDPKTDQWSKGQADAHDSVIYSDAVVTSGVYAAQKIYVIGTSYDFDNAILHNSVYDPISNTWLSIKPLPTARDGFGVAIVDDILYVIGGYTSNELLNYYSRKEPIVNVAINEQYVPIGYSSFPLTSESVVETSFLNMSVIVVLVLTVAIVVVMSFFWLRGAKRNKRVEGFE
ncbi:MAG: hypothetical protein FWB84_02620 [Candidatus Bathyarchaeota archaeon]|uniref:Kelch repeat-containing protein n=1 Tax=Candidatus Bathycorpusculum sp. TaxID=2994959 RepID=UPI00282D6E0D|nr:hypothetical protein [Candidatus Termiticorpusculum sp.]MCL2257434.1 hypothetical protein [Candidatus Termiticorpusculum sp.]MCL2292463.1 hypothetical protein [Candidatus Termiticorpusculum sp.]